MTTDHPAPPELPPATTPAPMPERSVAFVIVVSLITCGIYSLIWFVKTKREMVDMGADIPTAWLIIVPFANIYWMWKWSGGVDLVTEQLPRGRMTQPIAFLLILVLDIIGIAIIQDAFNKALRHRGPTIPHAQVVS